MTDWQDWNNPQEESRREMARPLAFSAVFHLLVVLAFAIGWPFLSDREPMAQPLVIIDMVDIVPDTNLQSAPPMEEKQAAPAEKKPAPKIEKASSLTPPPPPAPAPPPPPPPPPAPAPPPPPPPAPAPEAPAKAEILPDKKIAAPVSRPKARPAPPQPVKVATPLARPKPPKRPEKKQQPARDNKLVQKSQQKQKRDEALTGVLQNLAKAKSVRQAEKQVEDRKKKASQTLNQALSKATSQAKADAAKTPAAKQADLSSISQAVQQAVRAPQPVRPQKMGISELDRVRNHIAGCWQPPVAAPGAETLKVDIRVKLDRDGSVREASIQNDRRYRSDRFFKVAADAALRAVLECSPLPLPTEKYDLWKEFIFGFDPRFIAG